MRRYTAAQARQRLSEVLDAAERGRPAVIERRGVRFVVQAQRGAARRRARRSLIASVDPVVAAGAWTWAWRGDGLRFTARRPRR